jgi:hypothetical protein
MSGLALAQEERRARGEATLDVWVEQRLDKVGLSEELLLGAENVGPEARKKLKGIIARLRKNPHPFTQCMQDLREHQPGWSESRRKKTCAVLKQLAGRGSGGGNQSSLSSASGGACVLLDDDVASLLDLVNMDALDELKGD